MRPLLLLVFCALVSCVERGGEQHKSTTPYEAAQLLGIAESSTYPEDLKEECLEYVLEEHVVEVNKIVFSDVADFSSVEPELNLHLFVEEVDSSCFFDAKNLERNGVDRNVVVEPAGDELIINTNDGQVIFEIKTFDKFGYEGEEFRYQGYNSSMGVHVVRKDVAEGFGYNLVYDSNNKVARVNGFPSFSSNGRYALTCRIDAENIVVGSVSIYSLWSNKAELQWEAYSDYSMLPIDAVWESDSTILLKLHDYPDENSYYKRKGERVRYGRLVIDNITDSF